MTVIAAPRPGGGSRVEIHWQRTPTTVESASIIAAFGVDGERILTANYKGTFDRLASEGG